VISCNFRLVAARYQQKLMKMEMIIRRFAGSFILASLLWRIITALTGSGSPPSSDLTCSNPRYELLSFGDYSQESGRGRLLLRVGKARRLLLRQMTRALGILGLVLSWSLSPLCAEPWTLERALQQALSGNPDARLAQQRIVPRRPGWTRLTPRSGRACSCSPVTARATTQCWPSEHPQSARV